MSEYLFIFSTNTKNDIPMFFSTFVFFFISNFFIYVLWCKVGVETSGTDILKKPADFSSEPDPVRIWTDSSQSAAISETGHPQGDTGDELSARWFVFSLDAEQ